MAPAVIDARIRALEIAACEEEDMNRCLRRTVALVLGCAVGSLAFADARDDLRSLEAELMKHVADAGRSDATLRADVKSRCQAADDADLALLTATADARARETLVTAARDARRACDRAKAALARAQPGPARTSALLAETRARLRECASDDDSCTVPLAAIQAVREAKPRTSTELTEQESMRAAAQVAQDQVDKLREKYKTAYQRGDGATAAGVALSGPRGAALGASDSSSAERARRMAEDGRVKPRELNKAIRAAQFEADRLVEAALARWACAAGDTACAESTLVKGLVAQQALKLQTQRATDADNALSAADFGLAILKESPSIDAPELLEAIAFRKLVEGNSDVRSFFGGDAVGLNVSTKDSTLSFRYVMDLGGNLIGRRNRLSLIFSAPTNKDGQARFIESADALKNLTSVKLVWQLTNAPFRLAGIGTLNDFSLGVQAGQESRKYWVTDTAAPTQATAVEESVVPLSLGVRWLFLANPTSSYKTMTIFGVDRQRSYRSADTETRCPDDPAVTTPGLVNCYTGSWGAPVRRDSTVVGLDIRQAMPAFDVGLKAKHNLQTHKLDVELPFYLVRDIPDTAGKPSFTAGISLARSTGEAGLKWGVFVSAPLSFSRPER